MLVSLISGLEFCLSVVGLSAGVVVSGVDPAAAGVTVDVLDTLKNVTLKVADGMTEVADTLKSAQVTASAVGPVKSVPLLLADAGRMEREGTVMLTDVLGRMPGVRVSDYGGVGGLKTVNVRNMGATHTGVCIDGVPVSDAQNGQPDLGRYTSDGVAEMRVWPGGVDELFMPARAYAQASLLEIISSKPMFKGGRGTALSARVSYGSFNTANVSLIVDQCLAKRQTDFLSPNAECPATSLPGQGSGAPAERTSDRTENNVAAMRLKADYLYSDGNYPVQVETGGTSYREKREGSRVSAVNIGSDFYIPAGNGKIDAKLNFYDSRRGLPGPVILYSQNPCETLHDRTYSASVSYVLPIAGKAKFGATASYSGMLNQYVNTNPIYPEPQRDNYWQQEFALGAKAVYEPLNGLELALADDFFGNLLYSAVMPGSPKRLSNVAVLAAKYRWRGLTATLVCTDCLAAEHGGRRFHRFSPAISLSYSLLKDRSLVLRAGWKDSYRVPTFNDLYYARIGNRDLKAEKAEQFTLGAGWRHNNLELSADAYYNVLRNKIIATPTMFIWTMRNIDRCVMSGVDISASTDYRFGKVGLSAGGSYSFQYAVDLSNPQAKNYGHQIQYTPRHSGSLFCTVETPWCSVTYTLAAVGRRYFLPQNIEANLMPAYFDHSVNIFHTFVLPKNLSLKVALQGRNLGGVNYEIIKSYPMPGRSVCLTIVFVL